MDTSVADCLTPAEWAELRRLERGRGYLLSRGAELRFSILDLARDGRLTRLGRAVLQRGPHPTHHEAA